MKQFFILLVVLISLKANAQPFPANFDGKKWQAPYFLDTIERGEIERFLIPISFAPSIQYKGVEDIRFTPGWSRKEMNEYWGYAFLWYLDGNQKFDEKIFEKNLTAYYTGLAKVNVDTRKISIDKLTAVNASFVKRKTELQDSETYEGVIDIFDFILKTRIGLNFIIHVRHCKEQNKTFVFHEVSPKPFEDDVWKELNGLWTSFRCVK
ncbi:MAG: hypothetical protein QM764_09450 [Chitinophagaceae bacterium]